MMTAQDERNRTWRGVTEEVEKEKARAEMLYRQEEERNKEVQKETKSIEDLLGKVQRVMHVSPKARGFIFCAKKGVFVDQAINVVCDYMRRHFGQSIVLELDDAAVKYEAVEKTLGVRELPESDDIAGDTRLRLLCFKKGDVGQQMPAVRDYVQRKYGPCFTFELANPDKDLRVLEVL